MSTFNLLKCSICQDSFQNPKTLDCLHSFCLECLENLVERNHSITCPICRTSFQFQLEDLLDLPTDSFLLSALNKEEDFTNLVQSKQKKQKLICSDGKNEAIKYCLDCEAYLCEICVSTHEILKGTRNHQLDSINMKEKKISQHFIPQIYCPNHQQKEIELFCDECRLPICTACVDQHSTHKINSLSNAFKMEKQFLVHLLNEVFLSSFFFTHSFFFSGILTEKKKKKKVKPKEKILNEGIEKCQETIQELEFNSRTTQFQINQLFDTIRTQLDEREQELLEKLNEIKKLKKKELELQKDELDFGIKRIVESCQVVEHSLISSSNNETQLLLLSMKNLYSSRLSYLSNIHWEIEPCHNSDIPFLISDEAHELILSTILNVGRITFDEISADQCLILRNEEQKIYENEEYIFEIQSYSKEGKKIEKGGNEEGFRIKIEGNSKDILWKIQDLNNGKYQVMIRVKNQGIYSVFISYFGVDLVSSPFQIKVLPKFKSRNYDEIIEPKWTFGGKGIGKGEFNCPRGLSVNSNGNIFVCDNHRVQIFDSGGEFISTFGSIGNGNGKFNYPYDIKITSQGNIIVSELSNHRIQIFSSKGRFISKIGSNGNENGQFTNPEGIALDSHDNIYVCDNTNHRIQVFNSQGKFIWKFGSKGNENGQFLHPYGVAINSCGNILVSDSLNHRIQIFDFKGQFISTFGSHGDEDNQFDSPSGICVDLDDNILVCDTNNHRIQVFDFNGKFITTFGADNPIGIAIDPTTSNILVSDWENHEILVY